MLANLSNEIMMSCPKCGKTSLEGEGRQVYDSRQDENGTITRRRRECLYCGFRFKTVEREMVKPYRALICKECGQKIKGSRK